ncbi:uncharacterized protein LOC9650465 [Selaginella moellendorffii]|uniref:uncharacterized protein LOC9650465 n=1 Tax=Selaginella moellendorffii TaxID=88036 RepID=UPI000D1C62B2|nr:uncharacterized protein LOC9650465 [Selaginella moellendorffii]|eukprot:XP_024518853.1 uncharacterized protein LOC9650465 [Selaginella moellendorffii]
MRGAGRSGKGGAGNSRAAGRSGRGGAGRLGNGGVGAGARTDPEDKDGKQPLAAPEDEEGKRPLSAEGGEVPVLAPNGEGKPPHGGNVLCAVKYRDMSFSMRYNGTTAGFFQRIKLCCGLNEGMLLINGKMFSSSFSGELVKIKGTVIVLGKSIIEEYDNIAEEVIEEACELMEATKDPPRCEREYLTCLSRDPEINILKLVYSWRFGCRVSKRLDTVDCEALIQKREDRSIILLQMRDSDTENLLPYDTVKHRLTHLACHLDHPLHDDQFEEKVKDATRLQHSVSMSIWVKHAEKKLTADVARLIGADSEGALGAIPELLRPPVFVIQAIVSSHAGRGWSLELFALGILMGVHRRIEATAPDDFLIVKNAACAVMVKNHRFLSLLAGADVQGPLLQFVGIDADADLSDLELVLRSWMCYLYIVTREHCSKLTKH